MAKKPFESLLKPVKFESPLKGAKNLSLADRVRVAVTNAMNPAVGAPLIKSTGIEKDVKNLSKGTAMPKPLSKAAESDNPASTDYATSTRGINDADNVKNPPKDPNRDAVQVGRLVYDRTFLKKLFSQKKELPLGMQTRVDENKSELPSSKTELNPETREKPPGKEHQPAMTREKLSAIQPAVEAPVSFDELRKEALFIAFLTGMVKEGEGFLPDYEQRPELLPFLLRGMYDEGLHKVAGFEQFENILEKVSDIPGLNAVQLLTHAFENRNSPAALAQNQSPMVQGHPAVKNYIKAQQAQQQVNALVAPKPASSSSVRMPIPRKPGSAPAMAMVGAGAAKSST